MQPSPLVGGILQIRASDVQGFLGLQARIAVVAFAKEMRPMQLKLALIPHKVGSEIISLRSKDGYINATAMCKAANRPWSRYWEVKASKDFAIELSSDLGIPTTELIQSVSGGVPEFQGTWVHPQIAIHLAQWLSPKFAVLVSRWVYEWLNDRAPDAIRPMPYHLRRYVANQLNVPVGHFSMLTEMTQALVAPLEAAGYTLPEHMWPDISEGRMFCKYLRETFDIDTDRLPTYLHVFEDGRSPVWAKAYPEALLPHFRKHFREVWLPMKSAAYFEKRDVRALEYLPRLLPQPTKKAS